MNDIIEKIFELSAYIETNFVKPYFGKIQTLVLCGAVLCAVIFLLGWIICGCKRHKWKVKYNSSQEQLLYADGTLTKTKAALEEEINDCNVWKNKVDTLAQELIVTNSELNDREEKYAELLSANKIINQALSDSRDANDALSAQVAELNKQIEAYKIMEEKYNKYAAADKKKKEQTAKAKKAAQAADIKNKLKKLAELERQMKENESKANEEIKSEVIPSVVTTESNIVKAVAKVAKPATMKKTTKVKKQTTKKNS